VEELKYLETTSTTQNSSQEEIKGRLKVWNACYHSVQHLLSPSLLSKNLKIKVFTCRTIILPVVYGCETWSLILGEERRLRVFENWILRRIFGPKRDEVTGEWRKLYIMRSLIICTPHQISFEWANREE
jgi:hypothetical protein